MVAVKLLTVIAIAVSTCALVFKFGKDHSQQDSNEGQINNKNHHHHHHHDDYDYSDDYHDDHDHMTCSAHERSYEVMESNLLYKYKHEHENNHCNRFVNYMKKTQDRSFHRPLFMDTSSGSTSGSDSDGSHAGYHTDTSDNRGGSIFDSIKEENNNNQDNSENSDHDIEEERRNLFSEYDDYIDNSPVIEIPVVFHVLYSTDRGNISDEQLDSQMTVLNLDFRAVNDEIEAGEVADVWQDRVGDSKIEFYKNATYRRQIASDEICLNESMIKSTENGGLDGLDPKYFLNIWICNISADGTLGYAEFPCLLDTDDEWRDGVVLGVDNVGSYKYDYNNTFYFKAGSVYNQGRTLTHEVGHWLNLYHIWGDVNNCSNESFASDLVSDTPLSAEANHGCPANYSNDTNSCFEIDPELGYDLRDMYENFMDYSDDRCLFLFTEEQVWRMRAVLSGNGCRKWMYYQGAVLNENQTYAPSSQQTYNVTYSYTCNDGCILTEEDIDNDYCDCSDCADESSWTCDTCGAGCPTSCSGSKDCNADADGVNGRYGWSSHGGGIGLIAAVVIMVSRLL